MRANCGTQINIKQAVSVLHVCQNSETKPELRSYQEYLETGCGTRDAELYTLNGLGATDKNSWNRLNKNSWNRLNKNSWNRLNVAQYHDRLREFERDNIETYVWLVTLVTGKEYYLDYDPLVEEKI